MPISAGTVVADAKMNMRGFDRSMKRMKRQGAKAASKVSDSFKSAGRRMRSVGMGMSAAITGPLVGAGALALKTAADYESLRQSMDILNKSAAEGARNFRRLKEFSAGTPFQLRDLAEAQNMLQGFGLSADDAFNSMKMIGDIAAVASGDIKGIGIAFGQAAAEGRLMTRDIRQLINQGVPAIKLLANTMGVAQSEVLDLASQGEISFEIMQQAFRDATSEGGMFADGMKQQAQTLSGVWSTLKDNFSLALGEIGQSMAKAFNIKDLARSLISNLQRFTDWFSNLSDSAKRTGFVIAGALGAGGPALVALGALSAAIGALISPVGAVIGAVGGLAAAFTYVADNWDAVKERLGSISWWRNAMIDMIQIFLDYNPIKHIIDGFNAMLSYFGSATIPNPFSGLSSAIEGLKTDTQEYKHQFGSFTDAVVNGINRITGMDIGGSMGIESQVRLSQETLDTLDFATKLINNNLFPAVKRTKNQFKGLTETLQWAGAVMNKTWAPQKSQIKQVSQAAQTAGRSLGQMFDQAVLHGKNFMGVVKNILKQLASKIFVQGITALITGGSSLAAGSIGSAIFGGLFHKGGMVPGSGERMIRAQGGEMVLTQSQQRALGGMMGGGQGATISERSMQKAFEKALSKTVTEAAPSRIFELSQKGRRSY